jgi:cell division protein ZapA (FtsZ GTPase activity inhibitor)
MERDMNLVERSIPITRISLPIPPGQEADIEQVAKLVDERLRQFVQSNQVLGFFRDGHIEDRKRSL